MRSLVLDELSPADMEKLAEHLGRSLITSGMQGVYWLELPADLLSGEQMEHKSCGPHRVALVLEQDSLRLELLVRASNSLRCKCTDYVTLGQRAFLLGYLDRLVEELGIST